MKSMRASLLCYEDYWQNGVIDATLQEYLLQAGIRNSCQFKMQVWRRNRSYMKEMCERNFH